VERFDVRTVETPWTVRGPADYDSLVVKRWTQAWGKWLKQQTGGLQLYSCRHAWAVRSIRIGLNASLAAKTMGHSLAVHHDTYHRWLEQADVAAVAAALAKT
jgi:integrase